MPAKWTATTTVTLGDAGAAWAQSTMAVCSVTLSPGNTFMHPVGRFSLSVSFNATASISLGTSIDMYFQYGRTAEYAGTPSISHKYSYVGSFFPVAATQAVAGQRMVIEDVPLPKDHAIVYLFNGTAEPITASWALVMVPYSLTAG